MGRITSRQRQGLIYGALGVVFMIVSLVTGIGFFVLALSLVLIYKIVHLPHLVDRPVVRASLTVVLQLALFNVFGLLLHLIKVDVSANLYGSLSLLTVGIVFAAQLVMGKAPKLPRISRFDVTTLIPVVLGMVTLLVYLFGNSLSLSENLVRFMGSSSDQSAHLSMFNDILRNNGNHVYATDKLSINTPGINSYPMGWHQMMGVLSLNLFNAQFDEVPFIDVVAVYFACALITFVLFAVVMSVVTGLVYDAIYSRKGFNKIFGKKSSVTQGVIVKSFTVLSIIFLFLYVTFCELGYINFIYATAIMLLSIIFLVGLSNTRDISVGILSLFILLLFVATEVWYIMALPLGIILGCLTIAYLKEVGLMGALRKPGIIVISAGYLLLGTAFIVILRNILADGSSEQIQIGNAAAPWLPDVLVLLGVTIVAVISSNRGERGGLLHIAINGLFASILLLTVLNFLHLQAYSYYQQKMFYAFFAISIPIAFISLIRFLQDRGVKPSITLSLIPLLIYMINPGYIIYITKNIMRPTVDPEIAIITPYLQSKFNDKSKVIFIKDYRTIDDRPTELYARLLLSKVKSQNNCYNQIVMPLLSLNSSDKQRRTHSEDAVNKAAMECYGIVEFHKLIDS